MFPTRLSGCPSLLNKCFCVIPIPITLKLLFRLSIYSVISSFLSYSCTKLFKDPSIHFSSGMLNDWIIIGRFSFWQPYRESKLYFFRSSTIFLHSNRSLSVISPAFSYFISMSNPDLRVFKWICCFFVFSTSKTISSKVSIWKLIREKWGRLMTVWKTLSYFSSHIVKSRIHQSLSFSW